MFRSCCRSLCHTNPLPSKNFFHLLKVPICVMPPNPSEWSKQLSKSFRDQQAVAHPDISGSSDLSTQLNEAFETLKDPLLRCKHILHLNHGVNTNPDTGGSPVKVSGCFLLDMLERNEKLAELESRVGESTTTTIDKQIDDDLAALRGDLEGLYAKGLHRAEDCFKQGEFGKMAEVVGELNYYNSLLRRLGNLELER
eukprot:PhF_6_TR2543/c0_g1_i1/m.4316/K04082/hscB, HSCB, HSC20; molecular chaperone HscB